MPHNKPETQKIPTVLIIDDHPLFRDALATAASLCGIKCKTIFASSVEEAPNIVELNTPDLILLDLNLKTTLGLESLIKLQANIPHVRIALVTATEEHEIIEAAITLGVVGYLPKSLDLETLKNAIAELLIGKFWTPPNFEDSNHLAAGHDIVLKLASLTPAQRKVLSGLQDGLLNKQIAYEMRISEATVKAHLTAIFRKLGVASRTQALLAIQAITNT